MPPALVDRARRAILLGMVAVAAGARTDVLSRQVDMMFDAVPTMTMGLDEFTRYLNDDFPKWAHIVKVSGAKAE